MINREYLRSILFGVENSLISTVGLIAGISIGANDNHFVILGASVAIVIEAVAMGAGEYLSDDAVQDLDKIKRHPDNPALSGLLMMVAGTIAGLIPLAPVLAFAYPTSLILSITVAMVVLFLLGYIKGRVLNRRSFTSGTKTLVVGGLATLLGFAAGVLFKL